MLHEYESQPFEEDELYTVDGELLNMVVQLCKYFGHNDRRSHSVVNFVLSNLLQMRDNKAGSRWAELDEEEFRAELKRLGVIVPRGRS